MRTTFGERLAAAAMTGDSYGGAPQRRGASPVASYEAFRCQLNHAGVDTCDEKATLFLFHSVGARRLTPYVSFIVGAGVPDELRTSCVLVDVVAFDREVRTSLHHAIDFIETCLKARCATAIVGRMGEGALGDESNFKCAKEHRKTLSSLRRECARAAKSESACSQASGAALSASAAIDAAVLSVLVRLLSNLRDPEVANVVAAGFSANRRCLDSWLKTVCQVRNSLAHCEPYVVRERIPSVPKPVYDVDFDNTAPLYVLFVVESLLTGMAEAGGAQEEAELRRYQETATQVVGSFAWKYPVLAEPLRVPYDYVCGFTDALLPDVAMGKEARSLHYSVAAVAHREQL